MARPMPRAYGVLKRFIDMSASVGLLVLCSPVLGVAAIAIHLDSKGPVLLKPIRVGKDGREFAMFKLRTMVVDAEDRLSELQHLNAGGLHMIKIQNDPRVTKVGRVLRVTSVDELPQLVNVLLGDMSLIGPRPQSPQEVALYTPVQRRRLTVRPGITGLWQVRSRHSPSLELLMANDLEYIDGWSPILEVIIAGKTISTIATDTYTAIWHLLAKRFSRQTRK